MIAEEILKAKFDKFYTIGQIPIAQMLNAMYAFAKEESMKESITFANWMNERDEQTSSVKNEWIGQDMVRRLGAELYQLYLNSKK